MKQITLTDPEDISSYREIINRAAEKTRRMLNSVLKEQEGIKALETVKYDQVGYDPLDPERKLNLIEQVNQTFTYLASLRATEYLFRIHQDQLSFRLNLGTHNGSDIESLDRQLAAEVFAATHPNSNNKLAKDIAKVKSTSALQKYVFFACPNIPEGPYLYKNEEEVLIVSLGR